MGMLLSLAIVARRTGFPVIEVRDWQTRGHGPMDTIWGSVCHHTAGARIGDYPSLGTVVNGRPGLSGPLANLGLARSGTIYVIAAGIAHHAGVVRFSRQQNQNTIGIEAENVGDGKDPWPDVQLQAYAALNRELAKEYGPIFTVEGHLEVCSPVGRKVDPVGFAMSSLRALMPTASPTTREDFSIVDAATKTYLDAQFAALQANHQAAFWGRTTAAGAQVGERNDWPSQYKMAGMVTAADAHVQTIVAVIKALPTTATLTAAQITEAVAAGVTEAIAAGTYEMTPTPPKSA